MNSIDYAYQLLATAEPIINTHLDDSAAADSAMTILQ